MQRGKIASTCFWDEGYRTRALVHRDGFVVVGSGPGKEEH